MLARVMENSSLLRMPLCLSQGIVCIVLGSTTEGFNDKETKRNKSSRFRKKDTMRSDLEENFHRSLLSVYSSMTLQLRNNLLVNLLPLRWYQWNKDRPQKLEQREVDHTPCLGTCIDNFMN